jgi:hypothetical protein
VKEKENGSVEPIHRGPEGHKVRVIIRSSVITNLGRIEPVADLVAFLLDRRGSNDH